MTAFDIVIPSIGRDSLYRLLDSIVNCVGPRPREVVIVFDRTATERSFSWPISSWLTNSLRILESYKAGPAAARNVGWRYAVSEWICFLDDDVVIDANWFAQLDSDLSNLGQNIAGSQGRLLVPRASGEIKSDWDRNVVALESAQWATADMAYRRRVLAAVGGFDEQFKRAYREDADLALRCLDAGFKLEIGERLSFHPLKPGSTWKSIALQRGNFDDVLMRAKHGRDWKERAGAKQGAFPEHALVVGSTAVAAVSLMRKPRLGRTLLGLASLSTAAMMVRRQIRKRIGNVKPDLNERLIISVSSCLIPFAAVWYRLKGIFALLSGSALNDRKGFRIPQAILFDRDGTLIKNVPYNGDPDQVTVIDGARRAVELAKRAGVKVGIISNQSAVGRGLISEEDVLKVNKRVETELGDFDVIVNCFHTDEDNCDCRKPKPGLIVLAAAELGVDPTEMAVIGDIGADVDAAEEIGSLGVLVPNKETKREEIESASHISKDVSSAVEELLGRTK